MEAAFHYFLMLRPAKRRPDPRRVRAKTSRVIGKAASRECRMRFAPWFSTRAIQIVGWPLLGLVALARLIGPRRRPWQLEVLDTWALYVLAPWPTLAIFAIRARSAALGLMAGLGSALALSCLRSALGQGQRLAVSGGTRLRILTANVRAENPSAAGLIGLVEREQPDIVALQEVRPNFAAEAVQRLRRRLPHFEIRSHRRHSGAALFSRWRLEETETFSLSEHGHLCQRACISLDGQALEVFNVHLEAPFEIHARLGLPGFGVRRRAGGLRDSQIERLIGLVTALDRGAVVVGDFNAAAASQPHRRLLQHLRDAFGEAGRGLGHTFPAPISIHGLRIPAPLLRIDHVFFRGPLEPLSAHTVHQPGSDHRAVLAELALRSQPRLTS
jgi:endonuclease/exonuclease/phosphatase (EEP) superfamily protein YafD